MRIESVLFHCDLRRSCGNIRASMSYGAVMAKARFVFATESRDRICVKMRGCKTESTPVECLYYLMYGDDCDVMSSCDDGDSGSFRMSVVDEVAPRLVRDRDGLRGAIRKYNEHWMDDSYLGMSHFVSGVVDPYLTRDGRCLLNYFERVCLAQIWVGCHFELSFIGGEYVRAEDEFTASIVEFMGVASASEMKMAAGLLSSLVKNRE